MPIYTKNVKTRPALKVRSKSLGRPKGITGEATKRAILDAARLCFADYGYASTSNKEIAIRAGVTPGSIYHHFASKADLFLEVHDEIQQATIKRFQCVLRDNKTLADAAEALIDELLRHHAEMPSYSKFNAVVRIEASRNPEIGAAMDDSEWRALYSGIAKLGVSTGEIDAADERAVRGVFATLILGLAHHGAEASPTSHRQALKGLKKLFLGKLWSLEASN
jgi:AcrR family transcriptional regulator